ncbi:MAG: lambda-exonuclease family protein [Actinomycetes bacterium]
MGNVAFYLVESLTQGSSEWLAWRRKVIGASDAPTIMGENPWESADHLMREKLGLETPFAGNDATREGQRLEPSARSALSKAYGVKLSPAVIQDGEVPFIAASLDGLAADNSQIFEIKCGEKAYARTKANREVPHYYAAQLQHMLMVSGHKTLIFAAFRPGEPLVTLEVKRNKAYIDRLRKTEQAFMDRLVARGHGAQKQFVGRRVG